MTGDDGRSLWTLIRAAGLHGQALMTAKESVFLSGLEKGSAIEGGASRLEGEALFIAVREQAAAALALIELDGVASRIVLCPPDLPADAIPAAMEAAEIGAIVTDCEEVPFRKAHGWKVLRCGTVIEKASVDRPAPYDTDWVLFTSGTSGPAKMVRHSLAALTGSFRQSPGSRTDTVWATFYDVRRYGGLQIFLRAMLGGSSFVLSGAGESLSDHLERLADARVTHISGTPSHWRRVLMSGAAHKFRPAYIRLSGEIADQGVLDGLRAHYPESRIVHAYASTEAGVGFEVDDEQEGFPANFVGPSCGVELKVEDGTLRLRSNRTAFSYVSGEGRSLAQEDGFVDTGDLVELRGARYYFMGRKDGVINIGGQKVHPEEVEAVINRYPGVHMSLVRARKNPLVGSLASADVVLYDWAANETSEAELEAGIRAACAHNLARHKVPALIRFVPSLPMNANGKLARSNA